MKSGVISKEKIRAALCVDAQIAQGARVWNHANVLMLSNRLLSQDIAKEILNAWLDDYDKVKGAKQVEALMSLRIHSDKCT